MPLGPLALALLTWAGPAEVDERGIVEVGPASEVLYPPAKNEPWSHPGYGGTIAGSFHGKKRLKTMVGFGFDHVIGGWLGEPTDTVVRRGPYAGTTPKTFRGQLMRMNPLVRIGLDNDFAYGYFGFATGYALRIARLECPGGSCGRGRAVDHGLTFGLSIGGMIQPSDRVGFVVGMEVGLDWTWFPGGHPTLADWTQAMGARFVLGWKF